MTYERLSYDVPRENGFYWVLWDESGRLEIAEFELWVLCGRGLHMWHVIGTDESRTPFKVFGKVEVPPELRT